MSAYRDLDNEALNELPESADTAVECLRMLAEIPDVIADIGEQRLRGILFVVVPEAGSVVGAIAGSPDALLDAIEMLYNRIPLREAAS